MAEFSSLGHWVKAGNIKQERENRRTGAKWDEKLKLKSSNESEVIRRQSGSSFETEKAGAMNPGKN